MLSCLVYKNPWIVCPNYLEIELPADKDKISLGERWRLPDSNMEKLVVSPGNLDSSYEFSAGKTLVTWTASNVEGSIKSCSYHVLVKGKFVVLWGGVRLDGVWCGGMLCLVWCGIHT